MTLLLSLSVDTEDRLACIRVWKIDRMIVCFVSLDRSSGRSRTTPVSGSSPTDDPPWAPPIAPTKVLSTRGN